MGWQLISPAIQGLTSSVAHHRGVVEMCNIVRAAVTGDMSSLGGGVHMMPDGTVMSMAGYHMMPDGSMMANMDGMHLMPDGTMMQDSEMMQMAPTPEPRDLDPFIEDLCTAIEAAQTEEVNAMTGWVLDQGLAAEAPCAMEMGCPPTSCAHDSNMDGVIGVDDLLALLAQYGSPCP